MASTSLTSTCAGLPPKEPIYTFWLNDEPWAVPHSAYYGGGVFAADGLGRRRVLLHRDEGVPMFASTEAWVVTAEGSASELLARIEAGEMDGIESLPGFDTFWYNWIAINKNSKLMK